MLSYEYQRAIMRGEQQLHLLVLVEKLITVLVLPTLSTTPSFLQLGVLGRGLRLLTTPRISKHNHALLLRDTCTCMGGFTGSSVTSAVYYTALSSSGVGTWSSGPNGGGGNEQSCGAYNGYVYCVGGSTNTAGTGAQDSVQYSKITYVPTLAAPSAPSLSTSSTDVDQTFQAYVNLPSSGYRACTLGLGLSP